MPRPRSISVAVSRVSAKVMERIEQAMELDKKLIPTEAQAKVIVLLSKAQAILRTNKPMPGEEDDERPEEQVKAGIDSLEEETQHLKGGRA
jgi:hypothetical protein